MEAAKFFAVFPSRVLAVPFPISPFSALSAVILGLYQVVRGTGPHHHKHIERTSVAYKQGASLRHNTNKSTIADHFSSSALLDLLDILFFLDYPLSQTSYQVMGFTQVPSLSRSSHLFIFGCFFSLK